MSKQVRDYLAVSVADSDMPDILTPGALDAWQARLAEPGPLDAVVAALAGVIAELEAMCAAYHHDPPRLWRLAARLRAARETLAKRREG